MSQNLKVEEEGAFELGRKAYLFGYPIVVMEDTMRAGTSRVGFNVFEHDRHLLTPKSRALVSPNNDTLYSMAWLDLAEEPVVLHVPDTAGRYYVMQLLDMYTNNFYCIGRRVTGTDKGDYAIVGPRWQGTLPTGFKAVRSPTDNVWIIGRTLVEDEDDLPNVHALQDQYFLIPLGKFLNGDRSGSALAENKRMLNPDPGVPEELVFWEKLRVALKNNLPPDDETDLLKTFAKIGLIADISPYTNLDSAVAGGLIRAAKSVEETIKERSERIYREAKGWMMRTEDIGVYGAKYAVRTYIAKTGLGALVPEEALYPRTFTDGEGQPLNGKYNYVLHFEKLPLVEAFWSLTLYDEECFLVENEINRYSIGDRTKNILYNSDGSLDIYIQNKRPAGKESNWLPAPEGNFNLTLRLYIPKEEVRKGEYKMPPVQKT